MFEEYFEITDHYLLKQLASGENEVCRRTDADRKLKIVEGLYETIYEDDQFLLEVGDVVQLIEPLTASKPAVILVIKPC